MFEMLKIRPRILDDLEGSIISRLISGVIVKKSRLSGRAARRKAEQPRSIGPIA